MVMVGMEGILVHSWLFHEEFDSVANALSRPLMEEQLPAWDQAIMLFCFFFFFPALSPPCLPACLPAWCLPTEGALQHPFQLVNQTSLPLPLSTTVTLPNDHIAPQTTRFLSGSQWIIHSRIQNSPRFSFKGEKIIAAVSSKKKKIKKKKMHP